MVSYRRFTVIEYEVKETTDATMSMCYAVYVACNLSNIIVSIFHIILTFSLWYFLLHLFIIYPFNFVFAICSKSLKVDPCGF